MTAPENPTSNVEGTPAMPKRLPPEVLAEIPPSAWRNPPTPPAASEPDPAAIDAACAWSDFRKDYGVSSNDETRRAEHRAFLAGFQAGREGDQSGPLR